MLKKQLYLQILSNLIIPVLGFFWWNWNIYFIILFFVLDIISSEFVHYLKVRKIKMHQKQVNQLIKVPTSTYAIISALFLILTILIINFGMLLYQPTIDLKQEVWAFLSYTELGVPQGVVLIPLILVMAYMQFKTEFVLPKLYLHQLEKQLWKQHIKERFLLISFSAILLFIATGYGFPEWVVLTIILVLTSIYSYLQGMERIKSFASNQ